MKKLTFLLLFLSLSTLRTFACINESRVLLDGRITVSDDFEMTPEGKNLKENRDYYESKSKTLYQTWLSKQNIEDYSDYGVTLLYLGEYKKALSVFQEIEKLSPGLYATAANMGTTYELLGENQSAFDWIRKSIEIDSTSHEGSEWLHLKILEVKIKGNKYLNSDFLIGTNFGKDLLPESDLPVAQLEKLRDHIFYQLKERMSFIQPKEPIVALLLFELGNITAITDDATTALHNYEKAKEYGYSGELLEKRWSYVSDLQNKLDLVNQKEDRISVVNNVPSWVIIFCIFCFATVLIFVIRFVYAKRKR